VLFYDAAFGWLRDVPVGQLNSFALAGVGAGLRLEWTNYLHAQVDHAWRLRDGPVLDKQGRRTHAFLKILF
jgi:hemolysin activation/secretion protein